MGLVKRIYDLRFMAVPLLFMAVCWIVHLFKSNGFEFLYEYGVFPRTASGLTGIVIAPLLHGSWEHLINNSASFIVLSGLLFALYSRYAVLIFLILWLLSGIWLWAAGRPAYHIGASGLIYALASFHFFSGIFRKNHRLAVVSLLVVFLYGSFVWGVLPADPSVSFEGHFTGALAGITVAWFFRGEGPPKKVHQWPEEPEPDEPYWIIDPETDEKPKS